jgi:hypothetical protein
MSCGYDNHDTLIHTKRRCKIQFLRTISMIKWKLTYMIPKMAIIAVQYYNKRFSSRKCFNSFLSPLSYFFMSCGYDNHDTLIHTKRRCKIQFLRTILLLHLSIGDKKLLKHFLSISKTSALFDSKMFLAWYSTKFSRLPNTGGKGLYRIQWENFTTLCAWHTWYSIFN